MAPDPDKPHRVAPRASRALVLLGALQGVSVALYLGLARGLPSVAEACALLAILAYPLAAAGLLARGASVQRVNLGAAAVAFVCALWICALTGGLSSPFAPIFLTLPSSTFSAVGARGILALGAVAMLGYVLLAIGHATGLVGLSPLEGDALERARVLLFLHCVAVFVVVGVGVEAIRSRSTKALALERDRAAVADRAKSSFVAMISHELRTPLAGLVGALMLALDETEEPETRDRLAVAASSARSLRALLDDILDFSRIEAGRLSIHTAPLAPANVVKDVIALFTPSAGERGIALRATLDEGMRGGVLADEQRLRQVLSNLVGNSVKFTEKGEIEITGRTSIADGVCELQLDVRDTGPGMTEEQLGKLFQPFVQVHERAGGGGTGLGLVISRSIVEQMGGSLTLTSEAGHGTIAAVRLKLPTAELPMAPAPSPKTPPAVPAVPAGDRSLKVLVAEDSRVLQRIIKAQLQREGCEVVVAEDGQQIVELARSSHFDLVLMDVHMPRMSGLDATRALRVPGSRTAEMLVYGLSGGAFAQNEREALDAGMNGYLVKPIDREELRRVLERARSARPCRPDDARP